MPACGQQPSAQESTSNAPSPYADEVTRIETAIKDLDTNTELSDADRNRLKTIYQDTLKAFESRRKFELSDASDEARIKSVDKALNDAKKAFQATSTEVGPDDVRGMKLEDVESALLTKKQEFDAEQKLVGEFENERTTRTLRRKEIPQRRTEIATAIAAIKQEKTKTAPENENPQISAARLQLLEQQLESLNSEDAALEAELRRYDAENELLPVQTDLARRLAVRYSEQVRVLNEAQASLRKTEAERQGDQARRFAEQFSTSTTLKKIADDIERVAGERKELTKKLSGTAEELILRQEELKKLQDDFKRTKSRVENVGAISSIGSLLRTEQAKLPDIASIRARINERQSLIRETELKLYDAAEARNEFADPDKRARKLTDPDDPEIREALPFSFEEIQPMLVLQRKVAGQLRNRVG